MKKSLTPFLLKFALTTTLLTIIFRTVLSYGLTQNNILLTILASILYSICMFISGWYFGKKDSNHLPIFDIGFRFHFTTYFVFNLISLLWFVFDFNSVSEKIENIYTTILIWGTLLFFHFLFFLRAKKKTIQGINKEDLFD